MQISHVADEPEVVMQLIPGLLEHWRAVAPEDTWASRAERFRAHMNRLCLPMAWVAHQGGEAAGTAALRTHDLHGREDLGPWLGGVYVKPAFRGQGLASRLCSTVEVQARTMGFPRFYLFTLDQQSLYQHLGWELLEKCTWRGRAGDVMSKEL